MYLVGCYLHMQKRRLHVIGSSPLDSSLLQVLQVEIVCSIPESDQMPISVSNPRLEPALT